MRRAGAQRDRQRHDVVGPLGSLVDKSFVAVEHHAKPRRFRMLETVREYALERIESDPLADAYRRRHLRHFLALTARADAVLAKPFDNQELRATVRRMLA